MKSKKRLYMLFSSRNRSTRTMTCAWDVIRRGHNIHADGFKHQLFCELSSHSYRIIDFNVVPCSVVPAVVSLHRLPHKAGPFIWFCNSSYKLSHLMIKFLVPVQTTTASFSSFCVFLQFL